jgi:hypothetical protein
VKRPSAASDVATSFGVSCAVLSTMMLWFWQDVGSVTNGVSVPGTSCVTSPPVLLPVLP